MWTNRSPNRSFVMVAVVLTFFVAVAILGWWNAQSVAAGLQTRAVSQPANTPTPDCGLSWRIVSSPNPGPQGNALLGLSVVSPGNIWAVGGYRPQAGSYANSTLITHWNGSQWSVVPSPNPSLFNALTGVAAVSADDIWAVGHQDNMGPSRTLTMHWNGSQWSVVPSPNVGSSENFLADVAVVSANDVWAVGHYSGVGGFRSLVMRWDGSQWSVVPSPNAGTGNNQLRDVAVASANDIWAVGYYAGQSHMQTLVLHWDGVEWSIVPSPNPGGADNRLNAVTVVSANNVWAVGEKSGRTLALHWDGSQWTHIPSPSTDGSYSTLWEVGAASANDVWAVGYDNQARAVVLHWDGSQWSLVPAPSPGGGYSLLWAVAGISPSEAWAVGTYAGHNTLIERFSDPCATPIPSPTGTPTVTSAPTQTSTVPPMPTTCPAQFSDVPLNNDFYLYVHCLACRGIVSGYADGTFRPNNQVTRGQLAKIVSNAAGFFEPVSGQTFQDVPPTHTFYEFIERLTVRGYMTGYMCGGPGEPCINNRPYFRPQNNATRGQTSKIVANAAMFTEPPVGQTFEDVPTTHTFYEFVQRLATRNVMQGYPCGGPGEPCISGRPYFRPGNDVTRGQSSKIVANTFFPDCQTP